MTRNTRLLRFLLTLALLVPAAAVQLASAPLAAAEDRPVFQMPFNCNEPWYGGSYGEHSPGYNAIDWNQADDKDRGRPVLAGADGKVNQVGYAAPTADRDNYGNFVDVDAGGGWLTRYAHLETVNVREFDDAGKRTIVGPLTQIGTVGTTGLRPPARYHLHYEQRLNTQLKPAMLNNEAFHYTDINLDTGYLGELKTSKNCNGNPAPGGWYIGPSPSDGSLISGPLKLGVQARDNGNGGLKRVDITVFDPVERRWKVAGGQTFGVGVSERQVFAEFPTVWGKVYPFSFDVYSQNGRFQLAPSGVRQACTGSTCSPYAGGSGGGGGGIGGGGCLPNPQVNASISALSGDDGWVRSNATVTLSGFDSNGCGQAVSLEFSLDGGAWTTYATPITVNGDGVHRLGHRARSGGVTGAERELEVKIDTVPPVIGSPTISAPIDMNSVIRDRATISTPYSDATSGVRWVRHKCGGDPFSESSGGDASWILEGQGITACDAYARDIAGWETGNWNSGPLIFNMLSLDAEGTLEIALANGSSVADQTRAGSFRATDNNGTTFAKPVWLTGTNPVTITGNNNSSFSTVGSPVPVPRLSYPFSYYLDRSVHLRGPLVIDNVNTPLPPVCLYVDGDVLIRAVKLNSKVCLIATGKVTDQSTTSTFVSGDPANGMLIMAGGDVSLGSTVSTNTGLIFAPNSTVNFFGSNSLVYKGSVVARDISLSGVNNTQFTYDPGFAPATRPLPLAASYITPPPPPSTLATPTQSFPGTGTTMRDNAYCLIWSGSTHAYRFEVNRSATFAADTFVAGGDVLESEYCTKDGPPNTKLYWRVRALGVGDHESPWSDALSFTTGPLPSKLSVNDVSVAEGNSGTRLATFIVTRSGQTTGTASVFYETTNGSATAGSDYVGVPATKLSFAAGETAKSVSVTVMGDTTVEANETFFLNLSSPVGITMIESGSGTATITNDDSAPRLAVNDVSVAEGDTGTRLAIFTVTRSGTATGTASVAYQTMDGSATTGSDYQGIPATTLSFAAGESTKTVPVVVQGDTVVESDEWFTIILSSAVGATIEDGMGAATITNDDAASASPTLAINDASVTEGNVGTRTANFTVTRSGSTAGTTAVTYQTMGGSAIAGSDFVSAAPTTLTFAPGQGSQTVAITILGDTQVEPSESFYVMLTSYTGVAISRSLGTGTITNDD